MKCWQPTCGPATCLAVSDGKTICFLCPSCWAKFEEEKAMEFFVVTNSFAAPFCSDQGTQFVEAADAEMALLKVAKEYKHPAGLYAADCYRSADAYHKGE